MPGSLKNKQGNKAMHEDLQYDFQKELDKL
jgi:hypothetical protein